MATQPDLTEVIQNYSSYLSYLSQATGVISDNLTNYITTGNPDYLKQVETYQNAINIVTPHLATLLGQIKEFTRIPTSPATQPISQLLQPTSQVPITHCAEPYKVSLDKEYTRLQYVSKIQDQVYFGLNEKQKYEAKNILERWLIDMANDSLPTDPDPIFTLEKLDINYPATKKMREEFIQKYIPNPDLTVNKILTLANEYLSLKVYHKAPEAKIIYDTVTIGEYSRKLPPNKLRILLNRSPSIYVLASMILRYACLLPGGQQWSLPLSFYQFLVNHYGVTIEAFASPINSQIIGIKEAGLNFCSLFYDTDSPYGSLGNFFDRNFTGKNVLANPPYIEDIMNKMADKMITECQNASQLGQIIRFFIVVPEWTDAIFYQKLIKSPFLVHQQSLQRGTVYFVSFDPKLGETHIPTNFNTHLFVLAVNITDDYTDLITNFNTIWK